jgi:fucose 4-O-acetylase-like acetyltransferase
MMFQDSDAEQRERRQESGGPVTETAHSSSRAFYLDNIRSIVIVFVVLFHAILPYFDGCPWWYVVDPPPISFSFFFIVFLDPVLMPILFLISGLFAWPSFDRKGAAHFLDGKVRRLLVPFVLCTLLFSPIMPFIRQSLRAAGSGEQPRGFWNFYLDFLADGTTILTGSPDTSTEIVVNQYWFLMLLFIFFAGFSVYARMQARGPGELPATAARAAGVRAAATHTTTDPPPRSRLAWVGWIVAFTLVLGLIYAALCLFIPPNLWVTFGGLWQFQPTKVPIYLGLFMAGAYIGRRRLLPEILDMARPWVWLTAAAFITVAYFTTVLKTTGVPDAAATLVLASRLLRLFLVMSVSLALLTLFHRRLDRQTTVWRELGSSSYNIYLIHMTPLVVLQLIAISWPVPSSFKFAAVSLLTLVGSYVTSRFLVNKSAAAAVAGMALLFIGMCLAFR